MKSTIPPGADARRLNSFRASLPDDVKALAEARMQERNLVDLKYVQYLWKVGEDSNMFRAAGNEKTFGTSINEMYCLVLGIDESQAYAGAMLQKWLTWDEVSNVKLAWSLVRLLLSVEDVDERNGLLRYAEAAGLSYMEIGYEIRSQKPPRPKTRRVKRKKWPEVLMDFSSHCLELNDSYLTFDDDVLAPLRKVSEPTEEDMLRVSRACEYIDIAGTVAAKRLQELRQIEDEMKSRRARMQEYRAV